MKIPRSFNPFDLKSDGTPDPASMSMPYTDPHGTPPRDPKWDAYLRMSGGNSLAGTWDAKHDINQLYESVKKQNPTAEITRDVLGRQVIQVSQPGKQFGDQQGAAQVSHIHLDPQTGALSVNNANNPGGGFFITHEITSMQPLAQGKFDDKASFIAEATKAGVYRTSTQVLMGHLQDAASNGRPLQIQAQRNKSEYRDYSTLSPQANIKLATAIALPPTVTNEYGVTQGIRPKDVASFLSNTGAYAFFGNKAGSRVLTDTNATLASNYLQNSDGSFDMNKPKRNSQQGERESRPLYLSPSAEGAAPIFTSPFRFEGQSQASQGYKQNYIYTLHNSITPEGQAYIRPDSGLLRTEFNRVIPMPAGGIESLGLKQGAVYGNLTPGEGQEHGGDISQVEKLIGKSFNSYQGISLDTVREVGGQLHIGGGAYIPRSGSDIKFGQKAAASVTPNSSGIIPEGYDVVSAMPDAADLMKLGERGLAARYGDTKDFVKAMRSYAVGYDNLKDSQRQWVDENAPWIKEAPGSGGFSAYKANKIINSSGVIGGENSSIMANMSRDFALSNVTTMEWQDQYVDAATYNRYKDVQIDGKPMYENPTLFSGEGNSAMYHVDTLRDKAIAMQVYDQYQPSFDREQATLKAESLDKLERYNPGMASYLRQLDERGDFKNSARDIVTAIRANYQNDVGERARASLGEFSLSKAGSIFNLDSSAAGRLNFGKIHSEVVSELGEGAAESAINEEFLKRVANKTGNHALQMGNTVLPSARAALDTFTVNNESGMAVSNLGSAMAKALLAQSNWMQAQELGGGEDMRDIRDKRAFETLQQGAAMMTPEKEGENVASFMDKALGMTMPVVAGAAQSSKYLAPGESAMSESQLFEMTDARTEKERANVLKMANEGSLGSFIQMFPEADSTNLGINQRIVTNEQVNQRYGREVLSGENPFTVNEQVTAALSKDQDGDKIRAIISGRYSGEGENRKFIRDETFKAMSGDELNRVVNDSIGGEGLKQDELRDREIGSYTKDARKVDWKTASKMGSKMLDTLFSKADMATMYNRGIRGFTRFAEMLSDKSNLGARSLGAVRKAVANFSQGGYQAAIDLNASKDPALRKVMDMSKSLNWESSQKGSQSAHYFNSMTGKSEQVGSGMKETVASEVIGTFANIGLNASDLDMSKDKDKAEFAERLRVYRKHTARQLSVGLLPQNATKEQQDAAYEMLSEHADKFERSGGKTQAFNAYKFATQIAGKQNALHLMVGKVGESMDEQSPMLSMIAGTADARLRLKNPERANASMGLMSEMGKMTDQLGAFFKGEYASDAETLLSSAGEQNPSVIPHTLRTVNRMGGAGDNTDVMQAIAHLAPGSMATPAPVEKSTGLLALASGGDIGSPPPPNTTAMATPEPDNGYPSGGNSGEPSPGAALPSVDPYAQTGDPELDAAIAEAAATPTQPHFVPTPKERGVGTDVGMGGSVPTNQYSKPQSLTIKYERSPVSHQEVANAKESYNFLQGYAGALEQGVSPEMLPTRTAMKYLKSMASVYGRGAKRQVAVAAGEMTNRTSAERDLDKHFAEQLGGDTGQGIEAMLTSRLAPYMEGMVKANNAQKAVASGPRMSGKQANNVQEAAEHIERLSETLSTLSKSVEGTDKVSKEYSKTVQAAAKSYETLLSGSEKLKQITDSGRQLSPQEQASQYTINQALKGRQTDLESIRHGAKLIGTGEIEVMEEGPSSEERKNRVIEALSTGGRSGVKKRRKLSQEDWEAAEEETNISRGALEAVGGFSRFAAKTQHAIFAARQIQRSLIEPAAQEAAVFTTAQANRDTMLMQSGLASYGDIMGGITGDVRRRAGQQTKFQEEYGRQMYNSFSGIFGMAGGEQAGRAAGFASSILTPASTGAMIGGQFGVFGAGIGMAAGAAIGAGSWLIGASKDVQGVANTQREIDKNMQEQPRNIFGTIGGAIKSVFNDFPGTLAYTTMGLFNRDAFKDAENQANIDRTTLDSITQNQSWATDQTPDQIVKATAKQFGVGTSRVEASMLAQYQSNARDLGIDDAVSGRMYTNSRMYTPSVSMNQNTTLQQQRTAYIGMGADTLQLGMDFTTGNGYSVLNETQVQMNERSAIQYLNQASNSGKNIAIEAAYMQEQAPRMSQINQARRLANQSTLSVNDPYMQLYRGDTLKQGLLTNMDTQMSADTAAQDSVFSEAEQAAFRPMAMSMLDNNNFAAFGRVSQQRLAQNQAAQGYMAHGMSPTEAAGNAARLAVIQNPNSYAFAAAAAGGDRINLSTMARRGDIGMEYNTVDLNTGADAYRYNIDNAEYGVISEYAKRTGRQAQLGNAADYANGTSGIQLQMHQQDIHMMESRRRQEVAQQTMSESMTMGGAMPTLSNQGYALSGDGLAGMRSVFQSIGMNFNAGNGMSMWQVQDAQDIMNRQKQVFGQTQATQGLGLQFAGFDLGNRQYAESHDLQQRQFNYNMGFQAQSMQINRAHQVEQQQWSRTDLAISRDKSELEYGWQMQDADRNIRYARGRERLDLMRQKSRATIEHSFDMAANDRQGSRMNETNKWSKEEFDRSKANFEQTKKFQQENMDMDKRHHEEQKALEAQRMQLAKEANDKAIQWMNQQFKLEDQNRLISREAQVAQNKMTKSMSDQVWAATENTTKWQEKLQLAADTMADQNDRINLYATTGKLAGVVSDGMTRNFQDINRIGPSLTQNMAAFAQKLQLIASMQINTTVSTTGGTGGTGTTGGTGGIVPLPPPTSVAGTRSVSASSYGGALGDSQSIAILNKIVDVLERIEAKTRPAVTAYIRTNAPQIPVSAVTSRETATSFPPRTNAMTRR